MKTNIIALVIILDILMLVVAGVLFVYPSTKYNSYVPTSATTRTLVYFFKPQQFSFELIVSPNDHYVLISKSSSSVKASLAQYNDQSISTMFNGWVRTDKAQYDQIIIAPTSCTYLRMNISLNLSERYTKLNDFDPNGQIQNNAVLKSLYCVTNTSELDSF